MPRLPGSPRSGRETVAPGVSLGKAIEITRPSPLQRAEETDAILPAAQKIIGNLHDALHWRFLSKLAMSAKAAAGGALRMVLEDARLAFAFALPGFGVPTSRRVSRRVGGSRRDIVRVLPRRHRYDFQLGTGFDARRNLRRRNQQPRRRFEFRARSEAALIHSRCRSRAALASGDLGG